MRQSEILDFFPIFLVFILLVIMIIFFEKGKDAREYQLQLDDDSVYIYDGDRLVGVLPFEDSKLDSVLINDNR